MFIRLPKESPLPVHSIFVQDDRERRILSFRTVLLGLCLCPRAWGGSVDSFSPSLSVQRSDVGVSIAQQFVDIIEREHRDPEPMSANRGIDNER